MNRHEDLLQQIARIARSSRDFFVDAYPLVTDPDVRTAFSYISEVKRQLLLDLAPWLPQAEQDIADQDRADHISPAAIVEKMYTEARQNFRGKSPAASAKALGFAEEQLLRLVERAFEDSSVPEVKQLLKSYYSQLIICREAMLRLRTRLAA